MPSPTPVQLDKQVFCSTNKFTYHGSILSIDGGAKKDIKSRLNKARNAFKSMKTVWKFFQYTITPRSCCTVQEKQAYTWSGCGLAKDQIYINISRPFFLSTRRRHQIRLSFLWPAPTKTRLVEKGSATSHRRCGKQPGTYVVLCCR